MHAMARCLAGAILSVGVALTLGGCGSGGHIQVAPTEGIVLLDGEPVEGVAVVLRQDGLPMVASGKTDEEGRFRLSTYGNFDGAPVGECVATVTAIGIDTTTVEEEVPFDDTSSITDPNERARANQGAKAARREKINQILAERRREKPPVTIPPRYSDPQTSELTFEIVASQNNEIEIVLTK